MQTIYSVDPIFTDPTNNRLKDFSFLNIQEIRGQNPIRFVVDWININSITNKSEPPKKLINDNDDNDIAEARSCIDGYSSLYCLDKNADGGAIVLCITEDITSKEKKNRSAGYFWRFLYRNKLKKTVTSWLLLQPPQVRGLNQALDNLNATYEYLILIGNCNAESNDTNMSDFLKICNLKNLVKQKTCHKNPEKPSCIDLILTNYQRSFQNTCVFQTPIFTKCHC